MILTGRSRVILSLLLLSLVACRSSKETREPLLIGAAISLQPVLDQAIARYDSTSGDLVIAVSYASSGTIRHQIEFGAPMDLYLSASPEHVDSLAARALIIPSSRSMLASNTLVLVMSTRRSPIGGLADLRLPTVSRIAIGQPDIVPAGRYAFQSLQRAGILADVGEKLVFTKDVQQVLVYVRTGSVDAGFVYGSDVVGSTPIRMIETIPDSLFDMIAYEGVIVERSDHQRAAARFLTYLSSPSIRAIFQSEGFLAGTR